MYMSVVLGGPAAAAGYGPYLRDGGPFKGPGPRPLRGPRGALKRARAQALKRAQGGP